LKPEGSPDVERIAKKIYYSIGEVGDLTGLKAHVLRYWETQFDVIAPTKNRAGNRVYKTKDIETILLIKHLLYERRYTLEGARQELKDRRKGGQLKATRELAAGPELLAQIRTELTEVRDLLTLEEG